MQKDELLAAIELKDCITSNHCRKTAYYALKLGYSMRLNQKELSALCFSAVLHDVGKINIPDSILFKPDKLTEKEYEIVKKHSIWGEKIVDDLLTGILPEREASFITKTIRHHHERYDGQGYPDGLKGDAIPIYSQIIAVADAYDAMTSNRPYRKGIDDEKAVSILKSEKGKQFMPQLIDMYADLVISNPFRNTMYA